MAKFYVLIFLVAASSVLVHGQKSGDSVAVINSVSNAGDTSGGLVPVGDAGKEVPGGSTLITQTRVFGADSGSASSGGGGGSSSGESGTLTNTGGSGTSYWNSGTPGGANGYRWFWNNPGGSSSSSSNEQSRYVLNSGSTTGVGSGSSSTILGSADGGASNGGGGASGTSGLNYLPYGSQQLQSRHHHLFGHGDRYGQQDYYNRFGPNRRYNNRQRPGPGGFGGDDGTEVNYYNFAGGRGGSGSGSSVSSVVSNGGSTKTQTDVPASGTGGGILQSLHERFHQRRAARRTRRHGSNDAATQTVLIQGGQQQQDPRLPGKQQQGTITSNGVDVSNQQLPAVDVSQEQTGAVNVPRHSNVFYQQYPAVDDSSDANVVYQYITTDPSSSGDYVLVDPSSASGYKIIPSVQPSSSVVYHQLGRPSGQNGNSAAPLYSPGGQSLRGCRRCFELFRQRLDSDLTGLYDRDDYARSSSHQLGDSEFGRRGGDHRDSNRRGGGHRRRHGDSYDDYDSDDYSDRRRRGGGRTYARGHLKDQQQQARSGPAVAINYQESPILLHRDSY